MTDSTYDVNLRSPNSAIINLATFYNSVRLDAAKRIGLFDAGLTAFVEMTADYDLNPANRDDHNVQVLRPSNVRPQLAAGPTLQLRRLTTFTFSITSHWRHPYSSSLIRYSMASVLLSRQSWASMPALILIFFGSHGRWWIFYFFAMAESIPITSRNPKVCSAHRLIPSLTLWSRTVFIWPINSSFWIAHGTQWTTEIKWTSMKPPWPRILTCWPLCVCTKMQLYLPIEPSNLWPLTSNYMLQIKYNIQQI